MPTESYGSDDAVSRRFQDLKKFHPTHRGFWPHATEEEWSDYRWQLKNSVKSLGQLAGRLELAPEEEAGVRLTESKLAMSITPHFFSLIDPADPEDPIRRQIIPRVEETESSVFDMADPCGEDSHSPVPGLVHRYPDRVLFLVTDRCASYCRYCTRSRVVSGAGDQHLETDFDRAIAYIRRNPQIRDVLLSGGDPLLLADEKLDYILGRLREIEHVEFLRIGSRIPIFLPQRITPALCGILRRHHPLWMSIHTNHPRELTTEVREALGRLSDAGIPLGNQAVLLKGVNDDVVTMKALMHKLLMCRVRPYYIYQCDLIKGSSHLRTSVRTGLDIMEQLRGHTTGYGVPTYVIDAPGGGGKVPILPNYILSHDHERILIRNYEGQVFEYPETGEMPVPHTVGEIEYELEWGTNNKW